MNPQRLEVGDVLLVPELLAVAEQFGASLATLVVIDHPPPLRQRLEVGTDRFERISRSAMHRDQGLAAAPFNLVKDLDVVGRHEITLGGIARLRSRCRAERQSNTQN